MIVLGFGGAVTLATMLADGGDLFGFFVGTDRGLIDQLLVALVFGCAIGLVGSIWDRALGAEEFLRQRPIGATRLAFMRLAAVLVATSIMVVLGPVFGRILVNWWSAESLVDFWGRVPQLMALFSLALPAAVAVMLALALPVSLLLRIVMLPVVLAVAGFAFLLVRGHGRFQPLPYALSSLGFVAVLAAVAVAAMRRRYDPDRAWAAGGRVAIGGFLVLVGSLCAAAGVAELEKENAKRLHSEFPRTMRTDDSIVLARRTRAAWERVESDHSGTGELAAADARRLYYGARIRSKLLDVDLARFSLFRTLSAERRWRISQGYDDRAWLQPGRRAPLVRLGIGPEHRALPSGPYLAVTHEQDGGSGGSAYSVLAGIADRTEVFVQDRKLGWLVAKPLPNRDRFVAFQAMPAHRLMDADQRARAARATRGGDSLIAAVGHSDSYVFVDGGWQTVARRAAGDRRDEPLSLSTETLDLLRLRVYAPDDGVLPAFEHTFEPRTAMEKFYAGTVIASSLLRLPLLQVVDRWSDSSSMAVSMFHDPLIADGRRTWLFVLQLVFGVACAALIGRRLRRIGAPRSAVYFWVFATLCTGAVAVLLAWLCETRRGHAHPEIPEASRPRIASEPAHNGRDRMEKAV
ncbi:MAG: hypothetical protein AB8H80_22660 [Planctomycetota bacterium]